MESVGKCNSGSLAKWVYIAVVEYAMNSVEIVTRRVLLMYIIVNATTRPDSASEKMVVMGKGS